MLALSRLITGLYEEVHGLISDRIYDRKTGSLFQFGENVTNQSWPMKSIWTVNEQRIGARSGVIGWPQELMNISKFRMYQPGQSSQSMIDQMLDWFTNSDEPINFGVIYFREPGLTGKELPTSKSFCQLILFLSGRRTGPYSNDLKKIVQQCDEDLGYLLNKIEEDVQLKNNLHLIVTSPHGMQQINATNDPIFLEDYIDTKQIKAFGSETLWNIFLPSCKSNDQIESIIIDGIILVNNIDEIRNNLTKIPNAKVYRKADIPAEYHYQTHEHIGDLIILLNPGYELHRRSFRRILHLILLFFVFYMKLDVKKVEGEWHGTRHMAIMVMTIELIL